MRRRLLAGIALGLASAALVQGAGAYIPGGKVWPGGTIRYYNAATDQAWPVARAVWVWNHSGAHVHFVASTRASAQVIIDHLPGEPCVGHAFATLGSGPQSRVWLPRIDESSDVCNSYSSVHAVAHELGHVLGLNHETRGCALMNPSGTWRGAKLCTSSNPWEWRCEILEADDVRGAVALYGGKVAVTPRNCPLYSAIGAPLGFVGEASAGESGFDLRFIRPALPKLPAFLASSQSGDGFAISGALNHCPTAFKDARQYAWSVKAGGTEDIYERSAPGQYCYAVWSIDQLGRPSERPAWTWVKL